MLTFFDSILLDVNGSSRNGHYEFRLFLKGKRKTKEGTIANPQWLSFSKFFQIQISLSFKRRTRRKEAHCHDGKFAMSVIGGISPKQKSKFFPASSSI